MSGRHTRTPLAVLLGYAALSAVFSSRIFSWTNLRASGLMDGDPGLNAWALSWVTHALVTAPSQLLNGNAFYPATGSIALSEHMFSLALLNVFVLPFADSPWVGYNLLTFLAYLLSCTGAYRLTAYLTGNRSVAVFGGVFWGFLFFRIHHLGHLQMLSFQWMPYALFALLRFGDEGGWGNAAKLAAFVALQSLTSWYLAVINAVVLVVALPFFAGRRHLSRRYLVPLAAAAGAVALAVGAFVPAYVQQARSSSLPERMAAVSQTGDAVRPADFVTPPLNTWLGSRIEGNPYWIWQENTLFIGFVPLMLAGISVVGLAAALIRGRANSATGPVNRRVVLAGLAFVAVGYLFALGFVSRQWGLRLPLDYAARLVPFLYGLRATQRMALIVDMGVLLMAVQGLHWLTGRLRWRAVRVTVVGILAAAYLVEVFPLRLPVQPNAVFTWDAADQGILSLQRNLPDPLVVLHLPINYFRQSYAVSESKYLVGSTLHWAKLVNGFSGELPRGFTERMRVLNGFPSPEAWALMRELGIDVVALHAELSPGEQDAMTVWAKAHGAGTLFPLRDGERLLAVCFGRSARSLGCP